jgi:hypothetical protein
MGVARQACWYSVLAERARQINHIAMLWPMLVPCARLRTHEPACLGKYDKQKATWSGIDMAQNVGSGIDLVGIFW